MVKILALDYGQKRIGVAISDELRIIASSLGFIFNKGEKHSFLEIKNLCQKHDVGKIIVGLPKSLAGGETEQTIKTAVFIAGLKKELAMSVESVDERLTTVMAKKYALAKGRRQRDEDLDSAAACIFLQDYLDKK